MKTLKQPLSELSSLMTLFPQTLINVAVKTKPKIASVPEIVGAIETVEQKLKDKGRVLVRYSGTEPVCRVMVEGENQKEVGLYASDIAGVIKRALN